MAQQWTREGVGWICKLTLQQCYREHQQNTLHTISSHRFERPLPQYVFKCVKSCKSTN